MARPLALLDRIAPLAGGAVETLTAAALAAPGAALAAASLGTALVRGGRPLHSQGLVGEGALVLDPAPSLPHLPLFAGPREVPVLARFSHALGRPFDESDVQGLAVRLLEDEPADVLFASTGDGIVDRFVFATRAPGRYGPVTTVLPVQTDDGPLLLRATPYSAGLVGRPPRQWDVSAAIGRGSWQGVGRLRVDWTDHDTDERFDPILHPLAGASAYAWVRAVRQPAYWAGRRR